MLHFIKKYHLETKRLTPTELYLTFHKKNYYLETIKSTPTAFYFTFHVLVVENILNITVEPTECNSLISLIEKKIWKVWLSLNPTVTPKGKTYKTGLSTIIGEQSA